MVPVIPSWPGMAVATVVLRSELGYVLVMRVVMFAQTLRGCGPILRFPWLVLLLMAMLPSR